MSETRSNQLGWSSKIHDCVKIKHCKMTCMVWYLSTYKNIKKRRHYFVDKGLYSQSYDFSSSHVQIWELDHRKGWALKNWWFELWCWRRLLRVPWTARKSNQSILKEVNPGYSLEGLKLLNFGHLMQRANSLEKTLMLGKTEGRWRMGDRGWDSLMASPTQWIWVWANSGW